MFQRSTLTFGEAKERVAARGGKTTSDQLERAGRSIQAAIMYWNEAPRTGGWKWLATTAAVGVSSSNVGTLPANFRDVYQLEAATNGYTRPLDSLDRRVYRRAVWTRNSGANPVAYDMFLADAAGTFELIPPVDTATDVELAYFRNMTIPCSISTSGTALLESAELQVNTAGVYPGNAIHMGTSGIIDAGTTVDSIVDESTLVMSGAAALTSANVSVTIGGDSKFLDIPSKYERGIMAFAIHDFLSSIGAPEDRLTYWMRAADDELKKALDTNSARWEDMDMCIQPPSHHSVVLNPVANNVLS